MPEAAPLYPEMRVGEYLRFRAALKRVPRRERAAAVDRAMRQARVTDMVDTLIGHLSKGYRQRVGLADALVSNPPLLILDEPTAGLDPNQIREVRKLMRELGEAHTILLSTHILSEVEADLRSSAGHRSRTAGGPGHASTSCARCAAATRRCSCCAIREQRARRAARRPVAACSRYVARPTPAADGLVARSSSIFDQKIAHPGDVSKARVSALVGAGIGVREAAPARPSLEDVFAELTVRRAERTAARSEG